MPSNAADSRRSRHARAVSNRTKRVVTLRVPTVLDENIEAFSVTQGKLKSEIIIEAIRRYLVAHQLQPDKSPKLQLSY